MRNRRMEVQRKVFTLLAFLFLCLPMLVPAQQDEQDQIDEYFKMSVDELLQVEVRTAGKTPEKISDIPAGVVLITREDIETYGYMTLVEILESIPGLYNIDDYSGKEGNFGVRGFWSGVENDNMIILVNGVPQVDDLFSNYQLDKIQVPVEAIEKIEVIRGPMSVIYGNGAFYGAINIITTAEDSSDRFHMISASLGSRMRKKLFLRTASGGDDWGYTFNASFYDTGGIDEPFSKLVSGPATLDDSNVPRDARTGGKLESTIKYANFSGEFKRFFINLSYNETNNEFFFFIPPFADGCYMRSNTAHVSFGYKNAFSDSFSLEGKFTYTFSRTWQEYDYLFEDFYGVEKLETSALQVDIDSFMTLSDRLKITAGLYYRIILDASDFYDLPSFGNPDLEHREFRLPEGETIETRAAYAQVNFNPWKRFQAVAGVRLEQTPKYRMTKQYGAPPENCSKFEGIYDREKIDLIPRLAFIYKLNDKNIFKFLYGKAINRPSFFQNTLNLFGPFFSQLEPERIRTMELNYIASITPNLGVNISLFHNTLDHLIVRKVILDEQTGDYVTWAENEGRMVTNGIELMVNAEPFRNLRLELSGSLQETKDKRNGFEDIETAYSPRFLGYLKASYRTKKMSLALTGNFVGAMETLWDHSLENPNSGYGNRIGQKTGGYFLLGANFRIQDIFMDGLFLSVRCSNLLDEEIRYPAFTNNAWADRGTIGMGRVFLVSLGWKFH